MKQAVRKLGLTAFLFFLVKGLLWLVIPAGIGVWTFATAQEQPTQVVPASPFVGETHEID